MVRMAPESSRDKRHVARRVTQARAWSSLDGPTVARYVSALWCDLFFIGVSDGRVQARQGPEIIRGMTNLRTTV